jgi:hypothetical protein
MTETVKITALSNEAQSIKITALSNEPDRAVVRVSTFGERGAVGPQGESGAVGPQGERGDIGPDGLSAYEVAVVNGFVGTEAEWLFSLSVQNVAISDIEDNKLTLEADGLYVPPPQLASAQW